MNKLAIALAFSAIGATAASAQIITLNTGTSVRTDRVRTDGTWRREGNTDIYVRSRIDANGNRVVERARRDALGNFIIVDSRIVNRDDNRRRTDNVWKRSANDNSVYVRTRIDANGNRIMEKARRDANGNYVVFDTRVLGNRGARDRDSDRDSDRRDRNKAGRDRDSDRRDGKGKDGKWKKDKDGNRWDKAVNKGNGKSKGKNKD